MSNIIAFMSACTVSHIFLSRTNVTPISEHAGAGLLLQPRVAQVWLGLGGVRGRVAAQLRAGGGRAQAEARLPAGGRRAGRGAEPAGAQQRDGLADPKEPRLRVLRRERRRGGAEALQTRSSEQLARGEGQKICQYLPFDVPYRESFRKRC